MSDVSELRRLAVDLGKAASTDTIRKARLAVQKAAADIERIAQLKAPVDTGTLRNSIGSDIRGLTAEIGPTANYGIYLEYGTYRMRPQPYLGPATDAVEPGFVKAMEQIGGNIL